jgi:integrase
MKLSIQLKPKGEEEYYVFISLSHQSKRVLIATPYIIGAEHVKKGKIINRAKYAEIYNKELLKYEEKIAQIVAPEKLELSAIKDIITASTTQREEVVEFFSNAEKVIEGIKKKPNRERSASIYRYHLENFKKYVKRNKMYTFEITSKMIQMYIEDMTKRGKAVTTINNSVAAIRTLFNAVKDEYNDYDLGILNVKNDPFRKLVLPQYLSNASAKALSVDDIRKIIDFEIPKKKGYRLSTMNDGKDYFLLSFYLLGINPVDMYYLSHEQYANGRITYSRRKTQRRVGGSEISIPVCDKARELIEKHKGRGEWLLDMQQNYNKVEGVVSMVSKVLDNIYSLMDLGIDEDNFTWYSARHTWASIAANECHYSDAEVARALNHQSEHKVTRGYIRPDWSLLDRMNEAVLKVVFKKDEEAE